MRITKKRALALLAEAVEKNGADYADPKVKSGDGCTYTVGRRPGCIVGHALHSAGVKIKVLRELDALMATAFYSTGYHDEGWVGTVLKDDHGVDITEAAVRVFAKAQDEQDAGHTWGEALKAARTA